MTNIALRTSEELELLAKKLEIILHPAWYGNIAEEVTQALLKDSSVMPYVLRQGSEGEYDYWLSHKKSDGNIHHRHFTIRLFPDGLFFANLRAPAAEKLEDFIKGALMCSE
jgi:hypothetical protein